MRQEYRHQLMLFRRWLYKLMPVTNRWTEAAPAACCGVCRTCTTGAATGIAASAVGLTIEAIGVRRSEKDAPPSQPT
jgi:hypothetical protein